MLLEKPCANEAAKASSKLRLSIKDFGIGIPEDKMTNIFDRFYQIEKSSVKSGSGSGIGLALTKELIKIMNGE